MTTRTLDQLAANYTELSAAIKRLEAEKSAIRAELLERLDAAHAYEISGNCFKVKQDLRSTSRLDPEKAAAAGVDLDALKSPAVSIIITVSPL